MSAGVYQVQTSDSGYRALARPGVRLDVTILLNALFKVRGTRRWVVFRVLVAWLASFLREARPAGPTFLGVVKPRASALGRRWSLCFSEKVAGAPGREGDGLLGQRTGFQRWKGQCLAKNRTPELTRKGASNLPPPGFNSKKPDSEYDFCVQLIKTSQLNRVRCPQCVCKCTL